MDNIFQTCARLHLDNKDRKGNPADLVTLSSLVACSARPSADILKELSEYYDAGDLFKDWCLHAVTSAANPLISGITLSVRLGEVAEQATEGEQGTIADIQSSVNNFLLEIFERLPHTVRGFDDVGGVGACANLFEPGLVRREGRKDLGDPLEMVLSIQGQLQAFCKVPLVMNYLSSKFTLGLPDMSDTTGVLRNAQELEHLANGQTDGKNNSLVLDGWDSKDLPWFEQYDTHSSRMWHSPREFVKLFIILLFRVLKDPGAFLQAAGADTPNLVYFPGAQFVIAGVVGAPCNYYRVPAMRMALDFVVYLGMIAALSYFVLFHGTTGVASGKDRDVDHRFSWGEGACASIFIVVSASLLKMPAH